MSLVKGLLVMVFLLPAFAVAEPYTCDVDTDINKLFEAIENRTLAINKELASSTKKINSIIDNCESCNDRNTRIEVVGYAALGASFIYYTRTVIQDSADEMFYRFSGTPIGKARNLLVYGMTAVVALEGMHMFSEDAKGKNESEIDSAANISFSELERDQAEIRQIAGLLLPNVKSGINRVVDNIGPYSAKMRQFHFELDSKAELDLINISGTSNSILFAKTANRSFALKKRAFEAEKANLDRVIDALRLACATREREIKDNSGVR